MSSWKKTGGINYSSKFNTIRVQNAVASSSSVIKEIGEKNTVTNIKSDLHFKEDSSLFSVENVLDNRGLVAFYEFTDISGANTQTNGVIENKATFDYGNDFGQFDNSILDLEIVDISGNINNNLIDVGPNKDLQVENILVPESLTKEKQQFSHFNTFIRLTGKTPNNLNNDGKVTNTDDGIIRFDNSQCKALKSKHTIDFNNYHVIDRITDGTPTDYDIYTNSGKYTHHNTLTVIAWIRLNEYNSGENNYNPNGFMLFSIDDDVSGNPNEGDERLCFWAPGHKTSGSPQIHFGGRSKSNNGQGSNASETTIDINVKTDVSIPANKWTMISLVINGNRAYIYQEADESHKLTQEINIGDFRIPEKHIIVNGSRFYNMDVSNENNNNHNPGWMTNRVETSDLIIDIADFKVYNYAVDPHTIKRIYEHDNLFFNETVNFRLEPNFVKLGNDLIVGNDIRVNHDLMISNDLKTFGVSETYNNAFVAGSLGVGVKEHDPDYRLNVLGNLKTSGDIYLGDGSADYNAIYFRGVGSSNGEDPSTTRIIEKTKYDDTTKKYSELLLSKGTDVEDPDIIDGELISDSIRLRAPNVYIDTFDGKNGTDPNQDTSRFVFSKDGFLGINSVEPKAELDIRGTIHLTDDDDYNNIFITNEGTNVSSGNKPARNIGIGQGVLQTPNFGHLQGDNNVAIGPESSSNLIKGSNNVAIGNKTLKNNIDGSGNVAIGNESLINSNTNNNIALGNQSGLSTISGSNNIFLGNQASAADGVVDPTVTTPVTIEADSIENSIAIGKGAKISRCNGANIANDTNNLFVGINNPQPKYNLDISGNLNVSESLTIKGVEFTVNKKTTGDSQQGGNQLVFSSGITSQGPSIMTDKVGFLTISDVKTDPQQTQYNDFINDVTHDFQVVNRNMKFSNYPPKSLAKNLTSDLPFESQTFATEYTGNTNILHQPIPDYPIYFDGNITFIDNYNNDRETDKGFNVKLMDANFDQNLTINKKLTIQNLDQTYIHVKTIEITLSQNQADILNGPVDRVIPLNEGTINMHSIFETKTGLSISNGSGSGSGAVVDVVMTDSTNIQSITVKKSGSGYSPNDTITISYQPDPLVETPYEAFVVDPGKKDEVNPTMISNVDTTFTNDVSFNEYDLSGNPNVVNFNGKNVNFTHVDGEVNIIKDLVVNGNVKVNGSITREPRDTDDPNQASKLIGNQLIQGNVTIEDPSFVVSDTYVHKGFDVSANTHIRGHLTVDGDFNFEKAVLKNMIQEDHQTIRMSERVIIENHDTNIKTIQITLSQNQADILNGSSTNVIPLDEGTITIPTGDFIIGTSSNLQISGGSGSDALVEVVMTDSTTIQSITVTTPATTQYNVDEDITISTTLYIDAPALHVTQHGNNHNIAEFYDGDGDQDASGNPLKKLVMRVANEGVTDIYGRLGINKTPEDGYDLDVLGKTRIKDETRILNNVYIDSIGSNTSATPLCTLDITATDAIRIPVGKTIERPNNNIGMLRYNDVLGQIEYYGKGTKESANSLTTQDDADGWQNIAAGGRITSTHNAYISVGVDSSSKPIERLMVDTAGNVRIGEGRQTAQARLHIDTIGGTAENNAIMFSRGNSEDYETLIKTRQITKDSHPLGQSLDFQTKYLIPDDVEDGDEQTYTPKLYNSLTILPNGYIGMGTLNPTENLHTDPSGNLHVIDSSGCDVIFESGNNQTSTLKLKDASDSASFEYDGSADKINIYHTSKVDKHTQKMTMLPSGYIGIGTMSPDTRLHINETSTSSVTKNILRLTNFSNNDTTDNTADDITHQADFKLGECKDNLSNSITGSSMLELNLKHTDTTTTTTHTITTPTIMRLRSDGKVGINVADVDMDAGSALQVTNGDIVLGTENDRTIQKKIKMNGQDRTTVLTHTANKFIISQNLTGGSATTPLSIGQRDVTFDVSDSSSTSKDGSFNISGGEFNFTGRTFKINDLTIDASILLITIDTSGNSYTTGDNITITDSNENTIVIDTITATQADLLNGTDTISTFDITNITSYSSSFVGGNGLNITSTGSGSGATVNVVTATTKLQTTNNDIEIGKNNRKKIEIKDASGVNIELDNGVFSVGTTFTVDTSGNVDASGNIVAGGTGKFDNALIDGSTDAVFGYNTLTNKAITQTSDGATTIDAVTGKSINFNIAGTSKANIDSTGKFTIGNSSITSGTAQFNNGGLHVSSSSTQNLIITTITIHTKAITNYTKDDDITITDSSSNTIVIDNITETQAKLLNGTADINSTFDITNITSFSSSFVGGTGLTITSTGLGSGAKVDVVHNDLKDIGNQGNSDLVYRRYVLYDASNNSFGVEENDVYINNKKFHVSGKNTSAHKGILIDPFDSNNQIVTIEGNLRVNGKVFSNDIETDISATSIVAAVEGIEHSKDQLYIGKSQGESGGNYIQPSTYVTIAGNNNLHSMWAYGPVVSEQYFAATSDINLKENIFTINSALDKTNRMRGVYFNKKGSDKREVGVIAQEVEKVFPELVMGEEGKKTVAYANLTGVLIEAVKELSRENTSQATEIESLKAKVDVLTNNIQQLWEHKRADDNRMKNELADLKREFQHMKRNK